MVDVRIESQEFTDSTLEQEFARLKRSVYPRASRVALNKVARQSKTRIARISSKLLAVRVGAIRERIKLSLATSRSPFLARLTALTLELPAHKAGRVRKGRGGVARAGKQVFPAPAFVATMPNQLTSVWKRRGKARLPIEEEKIRIKEDVEVTADRVIFIQGPQLWKKEMERQLKRELERASP